MKSLLDSIQQRRSIFPASYSGENIPEKDLQQILEAGRWAPTHKKTEPWRYKVVQGQALCDLGAFMATQFEKNTGKQPTFKLKKMAANMEQSAAVILIFMSRDEKERIPEWEEIAAVSMSVQNMWLMAHDLGHGSYWSSPKSFADMSEFNPINVGDREKFLGFFYLGALEERPVDRPDRLPLDAVVQFIK
jgi:nitroreductase